MVIVESHSTEIKGISYFFIALISIICVK